MYSVKGKKRKNAPLHLLPVRLLTSSLSFSNVTSNVNARHGRRLSAAEKGEKERTARTRRPAQLRSDHLSARLKPSALQEPWSEEIRRRAL
ncbi:hypothetical protein Q7C36_003494 [Tachysurus vachellii]|uniref:Uncharacterized protein n=1 Tax=Tachysurus vachellii TaxID=175792 RepID=A0AA88NUI5_TACVA|nr:hypothetical protein Q7C36_003494 [Tachysurus vachellii]